MRFTYLIVVFIAIAHSPYAQNIYFNRVYDYNNQYDGFFSHIVSSDEEIYAVGRTLTISSPLINNSLFTKIDNNGNVVFNVANGYFSNNVGIAYGATVVENTYTNQIVVTGSVYDSVENGVDMYLHAFSKTGDSLWFVNLDAGYSDWAHGVSVDDDGGMLVVGHKFTDTSLNASQIVIIKTDSVGNKLWQKEYGIPNAINYGYHMKKTPDGGYIVSAERHDNGNQNPNLMLMKLDSLFNEEWSKTYDAGYYEFMGWYSNVIVTSENIYAVGLQSYFAPSSGSQRNKEIILKTDMDGNEIWMKLRGETFNDIGNVGIVEANFNEFVILGFSVSDTGTFAGGNATLTKIDSSSNIIWRREINYWDDKNSEQPVPYHLTRYPNGDLLFSGYNIYNPHPSKNNAWLVKTDSCGYTEGDVSTAIISIAQTQQQTIALSSANSIYCDLRWYFGDGDSSTANNPTHTYTDTGTYTIMLITRAGNDYDTAYITIQVTDTGIITNTLQTEIKIAFNIMPNPATDFMIIKGDIPPVYKQINFSVYDMVGKEVLQQTFQQRQILEQINVSQWARGMYSYRVTANGKMLKTGKVIIEH
jgi:hypothetical protein